MPHSQKAPRRLSRLIVTLPKLTSINWQVTCEMERLGFWHRSMADITTYLVRPSFGYYGWFQPEGDIYIPCVSTAVIGDFIQGAHTSLTDVLRHEWAHAVADRRPRLVDNRTFHKVFGGCYESEDPVWEYHSDWYLTPYAAESPCEDFAETFHFFLKHKGRLPQRLKNKPDIVRKWNFVASLTK